MRNISSLHLLKLLARLTMGILFIFASTMHFTASEAELKIIPSFLPLRREALYITGVLEFLGGVGLFVPNRKIQRASAWGLVMLLIAIFPANVYQAVANIKLGGFMNSPMYLWGRLPFQAVFIGWALWCTGGEPREEKRR
ncbi:MAG: hypothetical protein NVS2B2_26920 [Ktedonobacteraceae bacterium]